MNRAKMITASKIAVCVLLIAIFVVATVLVNVIYQEKEVDLYKIGSKCPDFELSSYISAGSPNGENFSSADARGQVLVVNFWYVHCGGCIAELPFFNEVQQEYGDEVKVIVVHASDVDTKADKQAYINKLEDSSGVKFSDYAVTFVQDTEELYLYGKLGGVGDFPITIIIDKEGIIRSVHLSSMTKESLTEEIEKWL